MLTIPTAKLSPWLQRLLWPTLLLSALALWWPQGSAPPVDADLRVVSASWPAASAPAAPALASASAPLPAELPTPVFAHAAFDPFVGAPTAASEPAKPALAPAPQPVTAPAPLQPAAPPMNYRYLGQMVDPGGRNWYYLARAEASFPIEAGTRLDDGYVVQVIDATGVHLRHPAMNVQAVIPLPSPARDGPSR